MPRRQSFTTSISKALTLGLLPESQYHNRTTDMMKFKVAGIKYRLLPGKKVTLQFLQIVKHSIEQGSEVDWKIPVFVYRESATEIYYLKKEHMLYCSRFMFKYRDDRKGNSVLCIEEFGKKKKKMNSDLPPNIFGRNTGWVALDREDRESTRTLRPTASAIQSEAKSEESEYEEKNSVNFPSNSNLGIGMESRFLRGAAAADHNQQDNFISHGMLFLLAFILVCTTFW